MSKLKEHLVNENKNDYTLQMIQVAKQLSDLKEFVDDLGSNINTSIGRKELKHTGSGNILVAFRNFVSNLETTITFADRLVKMVKNLK